MCVTLAQLMGFTASPRVSSQTDETRVYLFHNTPLMKFELEYSNSNFTYIIIRLYIILKINW